MGGLLPNINIAVNEKVYLKNPNTTDLGRRILAGSIDLISELGFENFTFKKLSKKINSTEASVYRYFVSKHHLLVYLISWYWGWMEYRIMFELNNIECPKDRLKKSIKILTEEVEEDVTITHINETKLYHLVITESSKIYLNKKVDEDNKEGYFMPYKQLVQRISDIILEINPDYKYPHMLVSTIIEGAHHQRFFAAHLPRLTDTVAGEDAITTFYSTIALEQLNNG